MAIVNFEFVGPLCSRKRGGGGPLWTHPITGGCVRNSSAVDRETSFDVCVNARPVYHFDLWDRHFLAEGDLIGGHVEVTSGHAEMSRADPLGAWACDVAHARTSLALSSAQCAQRSDRTPGHVACEHTRTTLTQ